jgi:amyloid beta precursor protein binding protein 1
MRRLIRTVSGIGRFTIVDEAVVSEADLGVNFFLDEGSLGKMRGQCSTELLLELNPEVQGDWYPKTKVRRPEDASGPSTLVRHEFV